MQYDVAVVRSPLFEATMSLCFGVNGSLTADFTAYKGSRHFQAYLDVSDIMKATSESYNIRNNNDMPRIRPDMTPEVMRQRIMASSGDSMRVFQSIVSIMEDLPSLMLRLACNPHWSQLTCIHHSYGKSCNRPTYQGTHGRDLVMTATWKLS